MKHIYFLRHGETELNRSWVHQLQDTPLTEKGVQQATAIAQKLKDISFDVIISSPYKRAQQTAEAVAHATGKDIEYNDLFIELRRPKALIGASWFSLKSLWIMGQLYLFAGRPSWHYADEENLEEFHARAKQALEYLTQRKEENILVVTHRGLMANMQGRMKKDGMDTIGQYRSSLWRNFEIGNCCYKTTQWSAEGENGETLTGTWSIEEGYTCPYKQ